MSFDQITLSISFETRFQNLKWDLLKEQIMNMLSKKGLAGRITRKVINGLPLLFSNFSNWTDYEQKSPELDFNNARNKNILHLFNQYKPKKILDIGANKGAFCLRWHWIKELMKQLLLILITIHLITC